MANTYINRQWVYAKRPEGRVGEEHYRQQEQPIDDILANNEVLVQARYISVDPYMRIQQHERRTGEREQRNHPNVVEKIHGITISKCRSHPPGRFLCCGTAR